MESARFGLTYANTTKANVLFNESAITIKAIATDSDGLVGALDDYLFAVAVVSHLK